MSAVERRRGISPGNVVLYMLIFGYMTYGFLALGDLQTKQTTQVNTSCIRQTENSKAILALGTIINESAKQTARTPEINKAYADFLVQAAKLDGRTDPLARAVLDLAIVVGGRARKPPNVTKLLKAEHQFLKLSRTIQVPPHCKVSG